MEQRRFCANCNAPAVKGASFCVVCGGNNFILPQVEETPVKAVEIEDAVVSAPTESKFIKTADENDATVDLRFDQPFATPQPMYEQPAYTPQPAYETQPVYEQPAYNPQPVAENYAPAQQRVAPILPDEGRTVAYKSFEEYERELAEQEALRGETKKQKSGGAKRVLKKIGYAILCILLSVALLAGGFAIGVYFTYNGALDEYLPEKPVEVDEKLQKQADDCYESQQELAKTIKSYITSNGIYVDKTTIITIESTDDGERCLISVEGDCLTSAECASLLGNDFICPSEGAIVAKVIPYVDSDGKSMFKIEVACDGGEGDYTHY